MEYDKMSVIVSAVLPSGFYYFNVIVGKYQGDFCSRIYRIYRIYRMRALFCVLGRCLFSSIRPESIARDDTLQASPDET